MKFLKVKNYYINLDGVAFIFTSDKEISFNYLDYNHPLDFVKRPPFAIKIRDRELSEEEFEHLKEKLKELQLIVLTINE